RSEAHDLAAAANRREKAIGLIGDEDEERALRRLLERLEQRVLRRWVHQIGFFDDEDFAAAHDRRAIGGTDQIIADDVDREIARFGFGFLQADELAVDGVEVGVVAGVHQDAAFASAAGFVAPWGFAEEE